VNRREFITLLGGGASWPLAARAQQPLPMVGILRINPKESEMFAEPFHHDMKELGWDEGRNIRFEFIWAGGRNEDVPTLARDLAARQPDIIVTFGNLGLSAVQRATATIPIVGMTDDMVAGAATPRGLASWVQNST
jgi:ABC-type uncharacterized transport system substrate-binding protein